MKRCKRTLNKIETALHTPTDQTDVIQFLLPGAGQGGRAHRIATHGPIIPLVEDLALKLKRAVKYDYVDLSTVENRHFC